nr:hypothetical protein [Tanacetum cinerariifolium]
MLNRQDKHMMKAQVHVLKSSAISDVQALPRRNIIVKRINLSYGKAYVEEEIVSKAFKILSMRVVTQDRKAA